MIQRSHSWACIQRKLYWKKMKTPVQKNACPSVYNSIILKRQDMEATLVPVNRQMDKEDVGCGCVCNGI